MKTAEFLKKNRIKRPGDALWAHAVNTKTRLTTCLADPRITFIECDVGMTSDRNYPVTFHDRSEEKRGMPFGDLVADINRSAKGLKVDFKDPKAITPCLALLLNYPPKFTMLNADILQGNGAEPSEFEMSFLNLPRLSGLPNSISSIGWTTSPNHPYTERNVDQMLELLTGLRKEVTVPVRACLLPASWHHLRRLMDHPLLTLTVWNNEPADRELLGWIKENTDPQRTFYDL